MPATSMHESLEKQPSVDQNIGPLAQKIQPSDDGASRPKKKTMRGGRMANSAVTRHFNMFTSLMCSLLLIVILYDWKDSLIEVWSLSVSACRAHFFSHMTANFHRPTVQINPI